MKYFQFNLLLILFSLFLLNSCATVFKGYDDKVLLKNAPKDISVYDIDGVEIPVFTEEVNNPLLSQTGDLTIRTDRFGYNYFIYLRSNQSHTLMLKYNDQKKLVKVYPKVGFWWGVLDFFCGSLPVFFDIYTGAWNHFDEIDAGF